MEQKPIRVLILEDEDLFRDMLHRALLSFSEIEVAGTASSGPAAIELADKLHPDVILADVELGSGPNGIQICQKIRKSHPQIGIVILSMYRDKQYLTSLSENMAKGWSYLLKQSVADTEALVRAIQGSAYGFVVVDTAVVKELRPRAQSILSKLTERQLQVLQIMAQGYTNAGIAQQLCIGEKAVENYINTIFHELDIEDNQNRRVKAVVVYLEETKTL